MYYYAVGEDLYALTNKKEQQLKDKYPYQDINEDNFDEYLEYIKQIGQFVGHVTQHNY